MNSLPQDMKKLLSSPEAAQLLKNKDALSSLSKSADAQQLMQLLGNKNGSGLQCAAEAAMKGDTSALSKLLQDISQDPKAAQAISNLGRNLPK